MSKEAASGFGVKIGSPAYWSRVNSASAMCKSLDSKTNYRAMLQEIGMRANAAIEEVYGDLEAQGNKIRYIPSSDRNALANQVEGLYNICKMAGISPRHCSDCIQALNMSVLSPWSNPFRDETAIDNAISLINHQHSYSPGETIRMLQEAAKWSVSFAAGADNTKKKFLEAVLQGKDNSFLKEVADEYESKNAIQLSAGRCGYSVGSRSYLEYFEASVFGGVLPVTSSATFGIPNYETAVQEALSSIADQLEHDLDDAAKQNDYITDETAAKLKSVLDDLSACGVNVGFIHQKIDKLAWFVGGDAGKILKVQQLLNSTGLVSNLTEDGVYGKKTQFAEEHIVDQFREHLEEMLLNEAVVKYITQRISLNLSFAVAKPSTPSLDVVENLTKVLFDNRRSIQRLIWKLGSEHYLCSRGYDAAAFMLEHSLEDSPSDLHLFQTHWITQKVMQSQSFAEAYQKLERDIQKDPDRYAVHGKLQLDFQKKAGDRDLYLGIGKCAVAYTCARTSSKVIVSCEIVDRYNFEELRSFEGDIKNFIVFHSSIGNLANDFGFLSQADGVISPYTTYINFQKVIEL